MSKNDTVYEMITEKIIALLEQGVAPWRKPWKAAAEGPRNLDGHRYRGINTLLLIMAAMEGGYSSPYWLTFNQAKKKGGKIKKGEKSTVIIFWKMIRVTEKDPDTGKIENKTIPMLRYYRVFNLEQTEGVKVPRKVLEAQLAEASAVAPDPIKEAEAIVKGYQGPKIRKVRGDRAFYSPLTDVITVPPLKSYDDAGEYYSTLFHEMGHSTGHKDRLDRFEPGTRFGDHEYGREELIAEMTAAFLTAEAGIETTLPNSASYLGSWIKTIKADVRAVVVAAGAAQRAADMILGREYVAQDQNEVAKAA